MEVLHGNPRWIHISRPDLPFSSAFGLADMRNAVGKNLISMPLKNSNNVDMRKTDQSDVLVTLPIFYLEEREIIGFVVD